ncbi:hypothetical protein [Clostridium saccharoperbutylacetonicum]|jgi:hypothetical protein|uniref:hypothetical protein n=1 Tax=Clostridium saccharoperbutylacetonicum TaxID=36745 RepID=UPI000983BE3B|nr:hypothetical protein [Clostridium saccharoperbutylacetonicum]AQR93826.1 hypothetical protein CLSAP_11330 [Clostridium saccharoperbutylacetonicum]NSB29526.1 hypothetical protein [Clostridium saccharoperbutylacetonicum]
MSDNKISSINKYSVSSVSKISTNTSITKRPYDGTSFSSGKGNDNSKSFKRTLKSSTKKDASTEETHDFTNLLSSELNDRSILDSRETSRIINVHHDHTPEIKNASTSDTISPEKQAKLRAAMTVKVDTSEIYKKLQLLNSIKNDSND